MKLHPEIEFCIILWRNCSCNQHTDGGGCGGTMQTQKPTLPGYGATLDRGQVFVQRSTETSARFGPEEHFQ